MSTDFQQLVQDFYDYFINLYRNANESAAAETFLAFEPIGTAITPEMFLLRTGEFSSVLALEQFSSLANTLPILDGVTIKAPSIKTVDGLYDLMIVSAQPTPTSDRAPFDKFRGDADEAFDRAIIAPLISTGRRYCPAVATPPDWCSPQGLANWSSKSFTTTEKTETTNQSGTPAPADLDLNLKWRFRRLPAELTPAVESPGAMLRVQPQLEMNLSPVEASPKRMIMHNLSLSQEAAPIRTTMSPMRIAFARPMIMENLVHSSANANLQMASVAVNDGHVANPAEGRNETTLVVGSEILAAQSQALNAAASSQEVTSKTLSLSFDYCLVTVTRPWVSTEFLTIKDWYLPGSRAGDISSGNGSGDAPFEVMPVAALVVKNLRIKADWSHSDQASIQDSVALGPFSLVGRSINSISGELTCPGMQIVGWVCEPMPMLPPASDPASE